MEDSISFPHSNQPLLNWPVRLKSFWDYKVQLDQVFQGLNSFRLKNCQQAAFALIWVQEASCRRYLLRWNEKWQMFNLVGGKVEAEDGGSIQRTMQRELAEELGAFGLALCHDVQHKTAVSLRQYSPRRGHLQNYTFHIFEKDLSAQPWFSTQFKHPATVAIEDEQNIWVRADEISRLKTDAGQRISPTTRTILQRLAFS